MKLENKVALVLGAIKGIGKGIGLGLAREGVKVALNYFDWPEELDQMKKDFDSTGTEHLILKPICLKPIG
jgi:3-oxoacyl-[acyl-carrier protein] reductase